MKRYRVKVQRWVCYTDVVEVVKRNWMTEREVRELATREANLSKGEITKNRTTILEIQELP